MPASSSPLEISISKPPNRSALSYEPHQFPFQSHQVYEAFLPPFHVPQPVFYPRPSVIYCYPWSWDNMEDCLNLYNPEMQQRPWSKVCYSTNFIPYDGKKKKGKRQFVPPRLRQSRDYPMDSQVVWVKKEDAKKIKASSDIVNGDDVPFLPPVTAEELKKLHGKTSLMIKNVPNLFQRHELQRLLDYHCRTENEKAQPGSIFYTSAYDFLYLPMDFVFHLNLGYEFVNFTTPGAALRFYGAFNNREWSCGDTMKKICKIGIAKFMGKYTLMENFLNSSLPCRTNEYLPVVFSPPRDGFNHSRPSLVGRRTHITATPKDEKIMIMTKRKINKKALIPF